MLVSSCDVCNFVVTPFIFYLNLHFVSNVLNNIHDYVNLIICISVYQIMV